MNAYFKFSLIALAVLLFENVHAKSITEASQPPAAGAMQASLGKRPQLFIENKGQIVDDVGKKHPELLFKAQSNGVQAYLSHTSIYYVFTQTQYPEGYNPAASKHLDPKERAEQEAKTITKVQRFEFIVVR
jgi:hypothetical protein